MFEAGVPAVCGAGISGAGAAIQRALWTRGVFARSLPGHDSGTRRTNQTPLWTGSVRSSNGAGVMAPIHADSFVRRSGGRVIGRDLAFGKQLAFFQMADLGREARGVRIVGH